MTDAHLAHLLAKTGVPDLLDILTQKLSSSELNALLLEVFAQKAGQLTPTALLRAYRNNRFVQPSTVDCLDFRAFEQQGLRIARKAGFEPLQLSPVAPLGSCSAVGVVHQHKVVSALRGTEVVADATNVLALESALRRQEGGFSQESLHFSVAHRNVRAQEIPDVPGFSAHFSILGLTTAGRDTGDFRFEMESLLRHVRFYQTFLSEQLKGSPVKIRLKSLAKAGEANRLASAVQSFLEKNEPGWLLESIEANQSDQAYYQALQFKVVIPGPDQQEIEIADGGFTDWTQRLTGNRKERFLISGIGLEYLFKIFPIGMDRRISPLPSAAI